MDKPVNANDIKFVKLDDISAYLKKIDRSYEDFYNEAAENVDELFGISYDDKIVGLAYIDDDVKAFIYLYIFDEYRRRGLGYAALVAAESSLKSAVKGILTEYYGNHDVARHFAEKCGYKKKFSSAKMKYEGEAFEEQDLPVRKYRDEDYPEAFAMYAEAFHVMRLSTGCFPDSEIRQPNDEERKYWAEHADEQYVYLCGDEIVGHARIDDNEIDILSIKISHQGKGLGRKFLKFLINRILEKNVGAPVLWCVVGNVKARRLYESLGFKEILRTEYAKKKLSI